MSEQTTNKGGAFLPLLGNVVFSVLGMTIALGLVEILMRAFPNSVPAEVRVNPPARRVGAFIDETYDLKQSDGDLHHYMRGHIKPLAPEQDQVVAHVHMITDAHGFRNSPPEKVTYDIVVLGDSFTRASGVASPWPHRLAEHTGSDVLNLGDVGFGPQDELKVLQEYGIKKEPEWVIMAYFEGNDSYDAASYEQANPFILFRLGRFLLGRGVEARHDRGLESTQAIPIPTHRYPINATINNKVLEMVFFSSYISWLSLSGETIEASQNYRLVQETILQAQELSESEGADFLLVYLPYLDDAGIVARVFTDLPGL